MSHFVVAAHCLNKPLDDTVLWPIIAVI